LRFAKYLLILSITVLSKAAPASAQDTVGHANPIISAERDSVSFYDRLDHILKPGKTDGLNNDSSFDWMVGIWAIEAKGFAKIGFRGKKKFRWNEPAAEYWSDENHAIFVDFKDSITLTTSSGKHRAPLPSQVILQYDTYGKVWVLQPGYHDRYDWGSLISKGWEGNKIVFEGTISISGLKITERETWTKISDHEFHILYEENLLDNSWFVTEENIFTRVPFPNKRANS